MPISDRRKTSPLGYMTDPDHAVPSLVDDAADMAWDWHTFTGNLTDELAENAVCDLCGHAFYSRMTPGIFNGRKVPGV